ncbi:uncharacterized protein VTP21DRAFT_7472 [Calcarisporiella thermophila]|uniref:uncharacterized protein n=1 Tax=Calcarisporiella thermophila TaxID=911321 RepID=UPI00374395ED
MSSRYAPLLSISEQTPVRKSTNYAALFAAFALSLGSHYAAHTLSALKSDLKTNLNISNAQYGVIQSSVSLTNTLLPTLGGLFIDSLGAPLGASLATLLVAIGNIFVAVGVQFSSVGILVFGRVVYGLGSGTVVICQETIISREIGRKRLAFVLGILFSFTRIASFMSNITVVPIKNAAGSFEFPFWFSAMFCVACFLISLVYLFSNNSIQHGAIDPAHISDANSEIEFSEPHNKPPRFNIHALLHLPYAYWVLITIQLVMAGLWSSFLHVSTELVQLRYGESQEIAAYNAGVGQAVPIILSPFLGAFIDRFGLRITLVILASFTLCLSQLSLLYLSFPLISMFLFSISLSFGPVGLATSIPLLLSLDLVGTAYGVFKAAENVGATLFDILIGVVQDGTPDGGYSRVIGGFLVAAIAAILLALTLWMLDRARGGTLESNGQSLASQRNLREEAEDGPYDQEYKVQDNWLCAFLFAIVMVLSWILYFWFVIHSIFSH